MLTSPRVEEYLATKKAHGGVAHGGHGGYISGNSRVESKIIQDGERGVQGDQAERLGRRQRRVSLTKSPSKKNLTHHTFLGTEFARTKQLLLPVYAYAHLYCAVQ